MGNPFWNEQYYGYFVDYNFTFAEDSEDKMGDEDGEDEIGDEDELMFYLKQFCNKNNLKYSSIGHNGDGYIVIGKYMGYDQPSIGNLGRPTFLETYPKVTEEDKKHVKSVKRELQKLLKVKLDKPTHILAHFVRDYSWERR